MIKRRLWCISAVSSVAVILGLVFAPSAFAGNYWTGGFNGFGTGGVTGAEVWIMGYDPYLLFNDTAHYSQSEAWNMLVNVNAGNYPNTQYMQIGWQDCPHNTGVAYPEFFSAWNNGGPAPNYGYEHLAFYGSGEVPIDVGTDYKITSDSTNYYLEIGGLWGGHLAKSGLKGPDGVLWQPDSVDFDGETYYSGDQVPGAIGRIRPFDPVVFGTGTYRNSKGGWKSLFYFPYSNDSWGKTTADNSHTSFEIYDNRY